MVEKLLKFFIFMFCQIKYVLLYHVLGARSIIHDLIYRRCNRVVLYSRPNEVAVVTGGARGIGSGVVKMLMECDVHVVIGCTSIANGEATVQRIRQEGVTTGCATVLELDLKSLKSVHKFAQEFYKRHKHLNLLVNNAGIMFGAFEKTEDGFESQFSVNYLGHFLLTHLLLPAMEEASSRFSYNPRIVNVSSTAHELSPKINFKDINMTNCYVEQAAYSQSKLCLLMFTKTMDRYFRACGSNIQSMAVHPGIVNSELFNGTALKILTPWVLTLMCKTIEKGATTVMYCCIDKELENGGGHYYSNCCRMKPVAVSDDINLQDKLYNFSIEAVKQFLPKTE